MLKDESHASDEPKMADIADALMADHDAQEEQDPNYRDSNDLHALYEATVSGPDPLPWHFAVVKLFVRNEALRQKVFDAGPDHIVDFQLEIADRLVPEEHSEERNG